MSFTNKVVLVTGASSGIGAAMAVKFGEEGAKVVLVGRNEKKLKAVAEKIEKTGSKPLVVIADVTKDEDAKKIINETIQAFGKLDVLINNAGMGGKAGIDTEQAMQVFDQVMNTNVRSIVHLTHLAVDHLIKSKGNIINVSSIAGIQITSSQSFSYAASKAALDHFSRSIAGDLGPKGVRVNTINPGPTKSDFFENLGTSSEQENLMWERLKKVTSLRRISEPEEVANLALFLASDKAVAITGAAFVSDNGFLVNSPV